jgi:hypothetical protein
MITISAALLGVRKLSKTDKDFKVEWKQNGRLQH